MPVRLALHMCLWRKVVGNRFAGETVVRFLCPCAYPLYISLLFALYSCFLLNLYYLALSVHLLVICLMRWRFYMFVVFGFGNFHAPKLYVVTIFTIATDIN